MSKQSYAEKFQIRKTAASVQMAKSSQKKNSAIESKASDGNIIQFIALDSIKDTSQIHSPSCSLQPVLDKNHDYYANQMYDDNEDLISKSDLSGSYDEENPNYYNRVEPKSNQKCNNSYNSRAMADAKSIPERIDSATSQNRQKEASNRKSGPPPLPVDKSKIIPPQSTIIPSHVRAVQDIKTYTEDFDDSMNDDIERLEREIGLNEEYSLQRVSHDQGNRSQHIEQKVSESNKTTLVEKESIKQIKYKPYTLEQYKQIQPKEYVEIIPKLKPDLNTEELITKRANLQRIKDFAKQLHAYNKEVLSTEKCKKQIPMSEAKEQEVKKKFEESKHSKRLEFAKHIPKPTSTSAIATAVVSEQSAIQQSAHVNGLKNGPIIQDAIDEETEYENGNIKQTLNYQKPSKIEELDNLHRESRLQIEAIKKSLRM